MTKPRMAPAAWRDGREPMGPGAAIGALMRERVREFAVAGATLRE
ncbi:hypothetical protein GCM10010121_093230 [Streptomyces brasiliensis]|uniref:Uncharacterized protein n=1 Tax=Streptomyces brasiliensis TaxID=1954 RepID=A0A917P9R2_9ACTN|nr:hypothetical protein GCM10010121_093230 [Streptomyces brasiliensis]